MPLALTTTTIAAAVTRVALTSFISHRPACAFLIPPPTPRPPDSRSMSSHDPGDGGMPPSSPAAPTLNKKELKIQHKKTVKEAKRARREGEKKNLKKCDLCEGEKDLLIRCQIDESLDWKMVCGKCWKVVSGGVVDGDAQHPWYKYGGLWKAR